MHPDIEALASLLDEVSALLRTYNEWRWADWLDTDARRIRGQDFYGIEHLLSAYGGMGSLNDVVLAGAQVAELRREDSTLRRDNEEFDALRTRIYSLAKRLEREEN